MEQNLLIKEEIIRKVEEKRKETKELEAKEDKEIIAILNNKKHNSSIEKAKKEIRNIDQTFFLCFIIIINYLLIYLYIDTIKDIIIKIFFIKLLIPFQIPLFFSYYTYIIIRKLFKLEYKKCSNFILKTLLFINILLLIFNISTIFF